MKQKRQIIPVHQMDTQSPLSIEFSYIEFTNENAERMMRTNKNELHRDDYYVFLFLDTADAVFTVDFEKIAWQKGTVFYIRPGQVHFVSSVRKIRGWSMAIDAMLVQEVYKNFFEGQFSTQKPIAVDVQTRESLMDTANLLEAYTEKTSTTFSNDILLNLANVFIGIIAEQYVLQQEGCRHDKSRPSLIANQFKELLSENFKTIKSPSGYARRLNYSLSHLNESVKNTTGFTVSYWIQQHVVLEAKRLLYYTDLDVKEIAFRLGYEDHTYFSRLFSKTVGLSPGVFRSKFRE